MPHHTLPPLTTTEEDVRARLINAGFTRLTDLPAWHPVQRADVALIGAHLRDQDVQHWGLGHQRMAIIVCERGKLQVYGSQSPTDSALNRSQRAFLDHFRWLPNLLGEDFMDAFLTRGFSVEASHFSCRMNNPDWELSARDMDRIFNPKIAVVA